jgi:DNA-binding response OmpR family regulator
VRFVGKIIILTFKDAEEKAVEEAIATLADMLPLEAIQPPHSPTLIFPGLKIRLHQRRVLKDGADISLTRLEYGALCYLAASPGM